MPRRGGWQMLWWILPLFGLSALGATLVQLPYYTLKAGLVRSTGPLISIDGEVHDPPASGISFTTVSVRGRISLAEAIAGWLETETEVVPESVLLQGRSNTENDQVNQRMMEDSKDVAVRVALDRIGKAHGVAAQLVLVATGSPAQLAGFQAGDLISAANGIRVMTSSELVAAVSGKAGSKITFSRVLAAAAGSLSTASDQDIEAVIAAASPIEVTLGESIAKPGSGYLGVQIQTKFVYDNAERITIDSGEVGGPSAGLAFTLGLIDALTPGELAGSQRVAVTGTINADGTVGPIGGLDHKVDAVRRAGVKLFLVPASQSAAELKKARREAKGAVEIVPVSNVQDALTALAAHGGAPLAVLG